MMKNHHGKGSIYRRKDGRWVAAIDIGRQNGRRKRISLYGESQKEVATLLKQKLSPVNDQLPMNLEIFLSYWLLKVAKPSIRPSTFRSYAGLVRLHIIPTLGEIDLTNLRTEQIQQLVDNKTSEGLSPRRVQYIHAVMRKALTHAVKLGLVRTNPAKPVNLPRIQHNYLNPYSATESKQFIKAIENHRLEALFYLTLVLGLKQGEVLGLCWDKIDFEGQELTVSRILQRVDGEYKLLNPKSPSSRRTIPLPPSAMTILKHHRIKQLEERLRAGPNWIDNKLIFTTPIGRPLSDTHVRQQFYNILKNSGLRWQRFQDLRHTCASLLLTHNVHPKIVMETLGHSTISFTINTYQQISSSAQRAAVVKIGNILHGPQMI